jgi:TetR/AcrR family tetracycline transcriptional repressor
VAVGLTRDQIVATALTLMDEHGQEWLTMRRLADQLGVAAPTLYWHVANRGELIDAAVDLALGGGDWRVRVATFMHDLRSRLTAHPCVTDLTRRRYPASVQAMTARAVEVAASTGLPAETTAELARLMIWQITGFTTLENTIRLGTAFHEPTGDTTYLVAAPAGSAEAEGTPVDAHLGVLDVDALFARQVELFVGGVETLLDTR